MCHEVELALSGGVVDGLDQQADVAVVDAGDGFAEAHRSLVGEACGEAEHSSLAARAGEFAGVRRADGGFPFDGRRPGAGMNETAEVVAGEPGAVGDDQRGGGFERVEIFGAGAESRRQ